ncbi:3-isopropylmalate dehydratase small subunit [Staphylococcus sp. EG-SA-6]|jgi:3-isopropylmalate/(R)-2-methylmalate dehydratase small subunit|uniref:3-isopropylmalate dehydratase small subunit n=5 Tax=Bacilli TaxID=91061 RepID=LEUD_STAHJ|nr:MULTISPECIES: 3-isopropylmalate dehydratase small subunit [Staphylococcus]Q4L7U3.1 RecName: Full=3-isopropylmalate dehydratase small subunit; AltName: Full=Alpha-IPM isomerase; Short=IPMI; AltName: Full=Isopropylmalate isomerase [Staphylococcus haemolyticus JCSC1435]KDP56060.1 3-isopropylmalate dehydratase, small subunit [Staphylococcus aureus subsp. aureus CO-98]MBN4934030.1 3-isopropylmalate dehydratase small subunit [Staphylococcus sp. EG-SA-6]MDU5816446.1 3-isopropylmalate dehydratase sm
MDIQPITTYTGKVVPLFNDNIDTDQIIPKVHLKRITKSGFGPFAFDEWRYLPDGTNNPDFNPNKPEFSGATILITGDNFGCGSSREHAAWALKDYGFNIIIAGSFSDIFFMNCTKNGMLPITLGENERKYLASQKEITIDLPNQTVSANDKSFNFQIDETWKHKLVNGLDDIAITLEYEDLIEQYENKNKG